MFLFKNWHNNAAIINNLILETRLKAGNNGKNLN